MNCPKCQYPNLPSRQNCDNCGLVILSPEDDRASRAKWLELSYEMRMEFIEKYKEQQVAYRIRVLKRKRQFKYDIIKGGSLLGIAGLLTGYVIIFDVVLGGICGWQMNIRNSGRYMGILLFGTAFLISVVIKIALDISYGNPFIEPVNPGVTFEGAFEKAFLFLIYVSGWLLSLVIGCITGMKMEGRTVEK